MRTLITLALACGFFLGLAAGQMLGRPQATDPALQAQMTTLAQRLSELDRRLAARSEVPVGTPVGTLDAEQLLGIVRTALAERDGTRPNPEVAGRALEPEPQAEQAGSRAQRAQLEKLLQGTADPDEMMPIIRDVVRSLK